MQPRSILSRSRQFAAEVLPKTRTWTAVFLLAILLAPGAAGFVAYREHRPAAEGDFVEFHVDIYDAAGNLRRTTDADLARAELAAGNAYLDPDIQNSTGVRGGTIALAGRPDGLNPSRYLVGTYPGDVVRTPPVRGAFGPAPTYALPKRIGPVEPYAAVPIERLNYVVDDGGDDPSAVPPPYTGPTDVGTRILYAGVVPSTIEANDGSNVTLRLQADDGARIYSRKLGFNFTSTFDDEGALWLLPQVEVGQEFTTRRCKIPLDFPPGRYRIVGESDDAYTLEEVTPVIDELRDEELVFVFRVIDVDPWPELLRAKVATLRAESRATQLASTAWANVHAFGTGIIAAVLH